MLTGYVASASIHLLNDPLGRPKANPKDHKIISPEAGSHDTRECPITLTPAEPKE